jgi:hypothetical protein
MEKCNIYQAVNDYLAQWDPIGLPQDIANVEYTNYVPTIVESLTDKEKVHLCLLSFLKRLGMDVNDYSIDLDTDVSKRADDLMKLKTTCNSHDVYFRIFQKESKNEFSSCYIAYDDEHNCVCRELELSKNGEVTKRSFCVNQNNFSAYSHLSLKDIVESQNTEFISKEEFESVWKN